MAEKDKGNYLFALIAMVAIVAIVAIVILFMNKGAGSGTTSLSVDEAENMAGQGMGTAFTVGLTYYKSVCNAWLRQIQQEEADGWEGTEYARSLWMDRCAWLY